MGWPTERRDGGGEPEQGAEEKPGTAMRWPPAILALAVGSFAIGTTEFLPAALLPTIAQGLGVSLSAAGQLISGYALGVTVMTPILTAAFATLPRKWLMAGLMGLFAVTNTLCGLAPNHTFLLGMRFLTAFSHGTYFAVASTAAASLAARGREGRAIALLFSGLTIAMATIVPLGALVGQALGWRAAFLGTALLGLIAMAGIARFVPPLPKSDERVTLRMQAATLAEPRLLLAFAMTAAGYAGIFSTLAYLSAILEKVTGFAPATAMLVFGMLGIGVTIGNFLGGRAADGHVFRAIVGLYGLLMGGLLLLWLAAPHPLAMVPAVAVFSVVMFSPGAGLQMLTVRQARRWTPGAEDVAAGLNQSAFNLGIALGALVGGWIVARPGLGLSATPIASIALVALAIGVTLVAWRLDRLDDRRDAIERGLYPALDPTV
jgi:predicted MFS family arabinose efflux permease